MSLMKCVRNCKASSPSGICHGGFGCAMPEFISSLSQTTFNTEIKTNPNTVWVLEYNKTFNGSDKTRHLAVGYDVSKILKYVEEYCDKHGLSMIESEIPHHSFYFKDGGFAYVGKSNFCVIEFFCYEVKTI